MYLPRYAPLGAPGQSIRLLHIEKGHGFNDIHCKLIETPKAEGGGCPYVALSYTWGGQARKPQHPFVLIDGAAVQVTDNLREALRYIRSADQDVFLWVDAFCINQNDDEEKSHQVAIMGDIYRSADEVIVWLGPAKNYVARLFDHISEIDRRASESYAADASGSWTDLCRQYTEGLPEDPLHRAALVDLLDSQWFTRIWIIQEIAYARSASIRCGPHTCPARTFAVMPQILSVDTNETTQAVLDVMPRMRKNTWWSSQRDLHSLICKFGQSQATRQADEIYALLGLSTDACDQTVFFPDYQKPATDALRDAASFLVFGRVLGSDFRLPSLSREQLRRPISMIAYHVLAKLAGDMPRLRAHYDNGRATIRLLMVQLEELHPRTLDLLPWLAAWNGREGALNRLLALGSVRVDFDSSPPRLTVKPSPDIAGDKSGLVLYLPLLEPEEQPRPPFREFKDMDEAIGHLRATGASCHELLVAYVWKGDLNGVLAQLEAGASSRRVDAWGHSALRLAQQRFDSEILRLCAGGYVARGELGGLRQMTLDKMIQRQP